MPPPRLTCTGMRSARRWATRDPTSSSLWASPFCIIGKLGWAPQDLVSCGSKWDFYGTQYLAQYVACVRHQVNIRQMGGWMNG